MVHFSRKWFAVPFILATLFAAGCCDHTYDYSDYEEYVIVTEEPLFLLQDKKIVPNTSVKDINGNPVDFASMPSAETPEFDVPVFKQ